MARKSLGYATGQFSKNHQGDRDEHLPTGPLPVCSRSPAQPDNLQQENELVFQTTANVLTVVR